MMSFRHIFIPMIDLEIQNMSISCNQGKKKVNNSITQCAGFITFRGGSIFVNS